MATETNGSTEKPLEESADGLTPSWVKPHIFEEMLKRELPGFRKIKDFRTGRAVAAGENYATIMIRIEIDVELQGNECRTLSFMMKNPHTFDTFKEMRKIHNVFVVEKGMYMDIIPELEELYRNIGLDIKFGAKAYNLEQTENDYILVEDLGPRGFKNVNRLEGLDMNHTKSVLRKLAQWHAASALRVATKGDYDEIYSVGFFHEKKRNLMKAVFGSLTNYLVKCLDQYEGSEIYADDVRKICENQMDLLRDQVSKGAEDFQVLNHGDCWSNNIMFQYDSSGKIKETYFVDLQLPKYGSPAQDLYYFLLSSTQLDIKLKKFDFFIKFYHDNLVEHLKLLDYPKTIPTLREIHMLLYKQSIWAFLTVSGVMSAVLVDPTEKASLENFMVDSEEGNAFKTLLFSNQRYKKHVEQILPWLHNRGALEV